jgi:hypothetical protein
MKLESASPIVTAACTFAGGNLALALKDLPTLVTITILAGFSLIMFIAIAFAEDQL